MDWSGELVPKMDVVVGLSNWCKRIHHPNSPFQFLTCIAHDSLKIIIYNYNHISVLYPIKKNIK